MRALGPDASVSNHPTLRGILSPMGNSYHALFNHFVWSTKNREPLINRDLRERLYPYMGGILRNIGGIEDHVHMLVKMHPSRAPAEVARIVKTNSSGWAHDELKIGHFDWQDSYSAFSVSKSGVDEVLRYLANQEEHHKRVTYLDELKAFFTRQEIPFKPEYLK